MKPPASPQECIFARTTHCLSADLQTVVTPCQLGGTPDCESCGCLAAAALAAVGRYRLPGGIPVSPHAGLVGGGRPACRGRPRTRQTRNQGGRAAHDSGQDRHRLTRVTPIP